MSYRFGVGQVHRQLDGLTYPLRKINELQELAVLAPVIQFAVIFDFTSVLLPIPDRSELFLRRRTTLPKVEKHWLARLRTEPRQGWDRAISAPDVLSVGDKIIVLL